MLFVAALCSFTVGGLELMAYLEFHNEARTATATMRIDDPEPLGTQNREGQSF